MLVEQRTGSVINGDKQSIRGSWEVIIVTAFTLQGPCVCGGRHCRVLITDE